MSRPTVLVVLGAGASYDCAPGQAVARWDAASVTLDHPWGVMPRHDVRPPLTKDLVADTPLNTHMLATYPGAIPLAMTLRARMAQHGADTPFPLEAQLADYLAARKHNEHVLRHVDQFRTYLKMRMLVSTQAVMAPNHGGLGGQTNHVYLVSRLYDWAKQRDGQVVFVSFNYDTILEGALNLVFGFDPANLSAHVAGDPHVRLFKPHGSIDWVYVASPEHEHVLNTIKALDAPTGEALVCHEGSIPPGYVGGLPALALPVRDKAEFVWPQEHEEAFDGLRGSNVRGVLTIGWNAAEGHFTERFRGLFDGLTNNTCVVAGTEDAAKKVWTERLRAAVRHNDLHAPLLGNGGFSHLCQTDELDSFIDALD